MTRLPRPTGADTVRALGKAGFDVVRIKGSHHFLQHPDGRATVVPVHAGETIGPGLMSKILRDVELTVEQFIELL
ncbi:MAG TPA: type II toxin-antitoxin system HicA family toxin [Longimicrobiaceae bacterium]|nr:type II toxin-antitoxin system HicA family toxin [Longimicrobiaceae bacterium]